ncbi:MAG: T9SS type A sorting domain-containing protein [Bacteroidetes bacterium]|nr:T9SS type A sorting domain-containing protein [Bacteroidota bacterium]
MNLILRNSYILVVALLLTSVTTTTAHSQQDGAASITEGIFGMGSDDTINAIVEDENGNLYFGGTFTEMGGVSGRIVKYDGENWHSLGFPHANTSPTVRTLAIRGDYLYAGGFFSTITHNGERISARNLARYHIPTGTWSEAGGGVNGFVRTIQIIDGSMYVGGGFTLAYNEPENISLNRIGILGSSGNWTPLVTGSDDYQFTGFPNGGVTTIYKDPESGLIYIGGSFSVVRIFDPSHTQTDGYRTAFSGGIVSWNGSRFSLLGGGLHVQTATTISSGTVTNINRDPHGSGLLVTGSFGMAYQSERTETALSTHDPETDPQVAGVAIWNGNKWESTMSTSFNRSAGGTTTTGTHFTEDRIYVFGAFNGFIRPHANDNGTNIRAAGIIVWDRTEQKYLETNNESAIGYTIDSSIGSASGSVSDMLKRGDDLYLVGSFARYQLSSGGQIITNNFMRYDGETFWQVGLGIDRGFIETMTKLSDGSYFIGGNFRSIHNHDNENHRTPLIAHFNPETRRLSPLGRGLWGGGTNTRVLDMVIDPATDDLYVAGLFAEGINFDGTRVGSQGLIRWSGNEWHEVTSLVGGGSRYISKVKTLKIVDDYLYFGGFFSTIPDRNANQLSIGRMHLQTSEFVPIPIPEKLSMTDRLVSDFAVLGDYLYVLMESHNQASTKNGSVFRIHRETDEIEVYNVRFLGMRSHERIQPWGELLIVSGRFSSYEILNEDGTAEPPVATGTNSFIMHPETGEVWTFGEWFDFQGIAGRGAAYDALAHGNAFYVASGGNANGIALQKLDLGTRQWSSPAPDLGNSVFARSASSSIRHLKVDGDSLWLTGTFTVPGNGLARTKLNEGTPGPYTLFNTPKDEFSLTTGDIDTLQMSLGNIGSQALVWNIAINGDNIPAGLIQSSTNGGTIASRSADSFYIMIDASDAATNFIEAEIVLTSNDPGFEENILPLRIFINRLREVDQPTPASGTMDVAVNDVLSWNGDIIADSVIVFLDSNPDSLQKNIAYAGPFTDSLSLHGLVQYYTDYYWQVKQFNAASTTESAVWTFRTELDPEERRWTLLPTDFTSNVNDIHAMGIDTLFAFGSNVYYRSTDGGETWETLSDAILSGFRFGMYASGSSIWLGRSRGELVYTLDAGDTWNQTATGISTSMYSVHFLDENNGFIGGDNGSLQRTADAGATWTVVPINNSWRINSIQFADSLHGYLVGRGGLAMKTIDGGSTWSDMQHGVTAELSSLEVLSNNRIFIGSANGTILESSDGGETWETRFSPPAFGFNIRSIRFEDELTGIAVGSAGFGTALTLVTFDGGLSWVRRPVPDGIASLNGLSFYTNTGFWAAGSSGSVLRYLLPEAPEPEPEPEPAIPDAIVLTVPANAETDVSVQPEFKWQADNLAATYHLQVAEDEIFSEIVINRSGLNNLSFTPDNELQNNTTYFWRVRGSSADGTGNWSEVWAFTTRTGVSLDTQSDLPAVVTLHQNYPNPFNPTTTIRFGLPETAEVRLEVFNILGQRVAVLAEDVRSAGWHTVQFNGTALSSGTYIYRLTTGNTVYNRTLMLIK